MVHLSTNQTDTEVNFAEFLGADHTLFARFVPQYPNAYSGPVLEENGASVFTCGEVIRRE